MATGTAKTPFAAEPLWRQAQGLLARGQLDAVREVAAALRTRGDEFHAALLAAQIAWRENRIRDATQHVLDAARVAPGDPQAVCAVANALRGVGENVTARGCLDRLRLDDSTDPLLWMQVAGLRKQLQQHAEALAALDRAAALGDVGAPLRYGRGMALAFAGRLEEAEAELAASLAEAPERGIAAVPLVRLRRQTEANHYLAALDKGARAAAAGSTDAAAFEFARYKTLEDLDREDEAWQALVRGNNLMHARTPDEAAQHHAWLERFLAAWPEAETPPAGAADPEGPQPIFIVGMPRSGTSVLERMLGNHSRVAVAGELPDARVQLQWLADVPSIHDERLIARLPGLDFRRLGHRYVERTQWLARGKPCFIDKQPPNWVLVGAIHAALPRAPILNLVRDPMDTCFSNWRAFFGDAVGYSYDFDALASVFGDYRRAMARWHELRPGAVLDVHYAELVRDPDVVLRRVFDFCGLGWEPGCSDLTRSTAVSATPSAAQVRSPLNTHGLGAWRRYAVQLEPLRRRLEDDGWAVA